MLKKFDATTTIPWEFVCYYDRGRKTKPITKSKRIVFDVKKYSCFIRKYTTPKSDLSMKSVFLEDDDIAGTKFGKDDGIDCGCIDV